MTDLVVVDNTISNITVSTPPANQINISQNSSASVVIQQQLTEVIVEESAASSVVVVYSKGEQGIQGIAGEGIGSVTLPTNTIISAHKVVYVDDDGFVKYASADDISVVSKVVGISMQSVTDNSPVVVQTSGEVLDSSWSWQVAPIYLGINGSITQLNNVGDFLLQLGNAVSSSKIIVDIKLPFIRG